MSLPKNVKQIGKMHPDCKVYVEDYVISYLQQLSLKATDRSINVSLYGYSRQEGDTFFYFIYGAYQTSFRLDEKHGPTGDEYREMERAGAEYFPEYVLVGCALLDGEEVEGFYIRKGDVWRYVLGYAQFYERNDAMLTYMLQGDCERKPIETEDSAFQEPVAINREFSEKNRRRVTWKTKAAIAGMFALFAAYYIEGGHEPSEEIAVETAEKSAELSVEINTEKSEESVTVSTANEEVVVPRTYVVCEGDTLLSICREIYGTDTMVPEVCETNGIENPDEIKVGQKILLP